MCAIIFMCSTLNAQDEEGETPLLIAVQENDPQFVKVLLQKGAGVYMRQL